MTGQTLNTMNSIDSTLVTPLKILMHFVSVMLYNHSLTVNPRLLQCFEIYDHVITSLIIAGVNSKHNKTFPSTALPQALCAFLSHRHFRLGSKTGFKTNTILNNYSQP